MLEGGVLIVVYFDLVLLLNFAMNWWLLWGAAILTRKKVRPLVLCGGALFGAVCAFVGLFVPLTLTRELILKGSVAAAMVALCFRPVTVRELVRQSVVLIALSAFSAGITIAVGLSVTGGGGLPRFEWYWLAASPLLASIPLRRMWSFLAASLRAIDGAGRFRFSIGGATVELDATLDTGNTLLEPLTYRPVVVVDTAHVSGQLPTLLREFIERWQEGSEAHLGTLPDSVISRVSLIPYATVAANGLLFAIRPEVCEVQIQGAWHAIEAVVAFAAVDLRQTGKGALLPQALWPLS